MDLDLMKLITAQEKVHPIKIAKIIYGYHVGYLVNNDGNQNSTVETHLE